MARMVQMARQFQEALDDVSAPDTRVAAGLAAPIVSCVEQRVGGRMDVAALEPVILQTTLASSMVAFLERVPWAAATAAMLHNPGPTPFSLSSLLAHLMKMLAGGLRHRCRKVQRQQEPTGCAASPAGKCPPSPGADVRV